MHKNRLRIPSIASWTCWQGINPITLQGLLTSWFAQPLCERRIGDWWDGKAISLWIYPMGLSENKANTIKFHGLLILSQLFLISISDPGGWKHHSQTHRHTHISDTLRWNMFGISVRLPGPMTKHQPWGYESSSSIKMAQQHDYPPVKLS
jgi:hypothetical protein